LQFKNINIIELTIYIIIVITREVVIKEFKELSKFEKACLSTVVIGQPLTFNMNKKNNELFKYVRDSLPQKYQKYSNEVWWVVSCVVRAKTNSKLGVYFSKQPADYTSAKKQFKNNVSRVKLLRIIDHLESKHLLTHYNGCYNTHQGNRQSCLIFTEDLLSCGIEDRELEEHFSVIEIVCSETGELLDPSDFYGSGVIIKDTTKLNKVLANTDIRINGEKVKPQYKRVFTNNLKGQGRYYTNDDFLSLSRTVRCMTTFNDEVTVGYDLSSTHARILYEIEDFKLDYCPYTINGVSRSLCKFLFMCMLYNDNKRDCINAVLFKIKRDKRKGKGLCEESVDYKELSSVCDKLVERNKPIEKYFFHDKMYWTYLQHIDSGIATEVIKCFVEQLQPILVWHDEYIVAESLEDKLVKLIPVAWKKVLGSNINCKFTKEF